MFTCSWKTTGGELRVPWLGQVQVLLASSHMELHPRKRSVQEDVRRCHNTPWLSSFGFEGDVCALPIGTHGTLFPWTTSVPPRLLRPAPALQPGRPFSFSHCRQLSSSESSSLSHSILPMEKVTLKINLFRKEAKAASKNPQLKRKKRKQTTTTPV